MNKVPAGLADVVGPLREADEYTRLQAIRQRGLYNIVTGLPMALFVLPHVLQVLVLILAPPDSQRMPQEMWKVFTPFLAWALFALSCFPGLFLPWVRRHRPDWQSPLMDARLQKRALEKLFWVQFPFWLAFATTPFLGLVLHFILDAAPSTGSNVVTAFHAGLLVAACTVLAWQARRAKDRTLSWMFLSWLPAGLSWAAFDIIGKMPGLGTLAIFTLALTTPPLIVGLARLLAPRRWLVR